MNLCNSVEFRQMLHNDTIELVDNDYLNELEKGNLDQEEWTFFLKQRYHASVSIFLEWLQTGERKAKQAGFIEIAEEIHNNYLDEIGKKRDGSNVQIGRHSLWRKMFYSSLGITDSAIAKATPLVGTKTCITTITALLEDGSVLEIIGALTWWEYYVVEELKKIERGMDLTFPHLFKKEQSDQSFIRNKKREASLYVRHHIAHDFKKHFQDLELVIMPFLLNSETRNELLVGMRKIKNARKSFWDSLINRQ